MEWQIQDMTTCFRNMNSFTSEYSRSDLSELALMVNGCAIPSLLLQQGRFWGEAETKLSRYLDGLTVRSIFAALYSTKPEYTMNSSSTFSEKITVIKSFP
jgi:hypothetical protein